MRKIGKGIALLMAVVLLYPSIEQVGATNLNIPQRINEGLKLSSYMYESDLSRIGIGISATIADGFSTETGMAGGAWGPTFILELDEIVQFLADGEAGDVFNLGQVTGGTIQVAGSYDAVFTGDGNDIPITLLDEPDGFWRSATWDVVMSVDMEHRGDGIATIRLMLDNRHMGYSLVSTYAGTFYYQIVDGVVVLDGALPNDYTPILFEMTGGESMGFGIIPRTLVPSIDEESSNNEEADTNQPNDQVDDNESDAQTTIDNDTTNAENKEQEATTDKTADTATDKKADTATGKGTAPAPQTGDTTVIGLLLVVMLGAVATISGLCYYKKKKA
jgi:hypothetical protein